MNSNRFSKSPTLIEPGVQYFLNEALKKSHSNRQEYYSFITNGCLFLGFATLLGYFLYSKYKGKLTPRERKVKERKVQEYLVSKLKMMEVDRREKRQELITGLPLYKSEFDIMHRNLYR